MRKRADLGWALLAALAAAGCSRTPATDARSVADDRPPPPLAISPAAGAHQATEPAPPANPRVTPTKEAGTIRGLVRWTGGSLPPPPASVGPRTVREGGVEVAVQPGPRLLVGSETKGVADVAVWLEGGKAAASLPAEPLTLVRDRGRFRPHVGVAQVGSRLELRTGEDRADFQASGAASFSTTLLRGQFRTFELGQPGIVRVRSEVDPWITPAFVVVVLDPHAAVSGGDGRFALSGVPPGDYQLVLWHPGWRAPGAGGPAEEAVTVRVPVKLGAVEGVAVEWDLPAL